VDFDSITMMVTRLEIKQECDLTTLKSYQIGDWQMTMTTNKDMTRHQQTAMQLCPMMRPYVMHELA